MFKVRANNLVDAAIKEIESAMEHLEAAQSALQSAPSLHWANVCNKLLDLKELRDILKEYGG
ncbi:hypothetical protein [Effusibacillus lacus]|uniref:Uncharacterized protein n=1 Tax=Effusibacillus lacus TaxID=1348429 RepID=A0A292YGY9_9BACL|nr:hypothetical protein [Effusibacillus lacus]TCS74308.1 hypothetical protein EDD64_11448 [Effusibacillus lacus]GAX88768.1 hypothetical protein EFBL_0382 [Effusibacillus lacus]